MFPAGMYAPDPFERAKKERLQEMLARVKPAWMEIRSWFAG